MKVVTRYICPPIPIRSHDWMAFFPDMEEDGPTGYGETEADALRDLADAASDLLACVENEIEMRYELAERERMDRMEVRAEMGESQ